RRGPAGAIASWTLSARPLPVRDGNFRDRQPRRPYSGQGRDHRVSMDTSTNQRIAADATAPARTLAQKLIARAAGRTHVTRGEIVTCQVDLAMFHDSSGPRRLKPMLEELGASIWDRSKVVLVL